MTEMIDSTSARLSTHEAVCAERYGSLLDKHDEIMKKFDKGNARMSKIEWILWGVIAAILLGPGAFVDFVKHLL